MIIQTNHFYYNNNNTSMCPFYLCARLTIFHFCLSFFLVNFSLFLYLIGNAYRHYLHKNLMEKKERKIKIIFKHHWIRYWRLIIAPSPQWNSLSWLNFVVETAVDKPKPLRFLHTKYTTSFLKLKKFLIKTIHFNYKTIEKEIREYFTIEVKWISIC